MRPALAMIPARGGSKRLPRKNILPFFGQPIIRYTVEAALRSECFDRVIVTTDDPEVANVAGGPGVEIAVRKPELADDRATLVDVALDLLEAEERCNRNYSAICVLYATSPLRTSDDIRSTMALLEPGICDFALCASEYDLPPYRALKLTGGNFVEPMWPDLVAARSSDMPRLVVNNGSTFAANVSAFRAAKEFFGTRTRIHLMPRARSTDIDDIAGFDEARAKAAQLGWKEQSR